MYTALGNSDHWYFSANTSLCYRVMLICLILSGAQCLSEPIGVLPLKETITQLQDKRDGTESTAFFSSKEVKALEAEQRQAQDRLYRLSVRFQSSYPPLQRAKSNLDTITLKLKNARAREIEQLKSLLKERELQKAAEKRKKKQADLEPHQKLANNKKTKNEPAISKVAKKSSVAEPVSTMKDKVLEHSEVSESKSYLIEIIVAIIAFSLLLFGIATRRFGKRNSDIYIDPILEPLLGSLPLLKTEKEVKANKSYTRNLQNYWQDIQERLSTRLPGPQRVILVTGCKAEQGASTVAANLASYLTADAGKVLLVDMDLHAPRIWQFFNLTSQDPGITEVLGGLFTTEQVVKPTPHNGLYILPAGSETQDLDTSSARAAALLKELQDTYPTLVLDCPPKMSRTALLSLAKISDGAIVVSAADDPSIPELSRLKIKLRSLGITLLGTILNKASEANLASAHKNDKPQKLSKAA